MVARSSLEDGRAPADRVVGAHYEDRWNAVGLSLLYDSATVQGEFYRDRMRRIAGLLDGVEGELLDVGCGTGQMIRFLRDTRPGRFGLTGLDRSESIIGEARRVVGDDPAVQLVAGRAEQMPFPSGAFHVVLAMGVLEYVASLDEAVREISRVTRPGGLTVTTMQNPHSPYRLWDATAYAWMRRRRGEQPSPILRRVAEGRLRPLLERSGLVPLSVVYYNFNLLLPPLDTHLPRAALRLQGAVEAVARGPLRRLANDYIVVARRTTESDVDGGTASKP